MPIDPEREDREAEALVEKPIQRKKESRRLRTLGGAAIVVVGGAIGLRSGFTNPPNVQLVMIGLIAAAIGAGIAEPTMVMNFVLRLLGRDK